VTLTINPNFPAAIPRTSVQLFFQYGVWNEGSIVIATQDPPPTPNNNASNFFLNCAEFFSSAVSSINASGAPGGAVTTAGGNGGGITINVPGNMINQGSITTMGGQGNAAAGNGGNGGGVSLFAGVYLWNTGAITNSGGNGVAAGTTGGNGGANSVTAGQFSPGGIYNSGTITGTGGTGPVGGGSGDPVNGLFWMSGPNYNGFMYNSGNFDFSGGNSTTGNGNGGNGAAGAGVILRAFGTLHSSGTFTNRGGNGSGTGNGGNGGTNISHDCWAAGALGFYGPPIPSMGEFVAISADIGGGNGVAGGNGGNIWVNHSLNSGGPGAQAPAPSTDSTVVAGLTSLNSSGGATIAGTGGTAGTITIQNQRFVQDNGQSWFGSANNNVPLTANGGAGTGAGSVGGPGGYIFFGGWGTASNNPDFGRSAINSAAISASGGNANVGAGTAGGGTIEMYEHFNLINTGALTVNTGTVSAAAFWPGVGGQIILRGDNTVTNRAALSAIGADNVGGTFGGYGGGTPGFNSGIFISGMTITSVGNISAWGGNSTDSGLGGVIWIDSRTSTAAIPPSLSGTYDVHAGTATNPLSEPLVGKVRINGFDVALTPAGTVTY
jgi:hypothetical protein